MRSQTLDSLLAQRQFSHQDIVTLLNLEDPEPIEQMRQAAEAVTFQYCSNLTPTEVRKDYQLYEGKPCIDEGKGECRNCLLNRVRSVGREVAFNAWGDSRHFAARTRG